MSIQIDVAAVVSELAQEFASETAALRANLAMARAQVAALNAELSRRDESGPADESPPVV